MASIKSADSTLPQTEPEIIRVRFYNSIIVRSVAAIALLTVVIMMASWQYRVREIERTAYSGLKQESQRTAAVLAQSLALPVWNLDSRQALLQLHALEESAGFCGARVKNDRGEVFSDLRFVSAKIKNRFNQSEDIYFKTPQDKWEKIGTLEVCIDTQYLKDNLMAIRQHEMIVSFLITLVLIVVSSFTLFLIVKPLLKIREAMGLVSTAMDTITDPLLLGTDEVGALARAFNKMVTDLKRTYHDLQAAKEQAMAADQYKSDFLANMSHELRTPLNSILGMTGLLKEDARMIGEHREMLETVEMAGHYLLQNVNDILDLSKIESGKIMLENIRFNFTALLTRTSSLMRPVADQKGLSFTMDMPQGELPDVIGDPTKIERVVINMLSNAVKYTEKGGVILRAGYAAAPDPDHAIFEIRVTDTGIGIPEDKIGQVFEKFVQADATVTRRFGGTGLGLTISRDLVEMMGGQIGVESADGKGSRFWFTLTLPLADAQPSARQTHVIRPVDIRPPEQIKKIPAAEAHVLVAEDHPLNQAYVQKLLTHLGFNNIHLVENGQDAVTFARNSGCDLILMDAHMPVMNGYDAADSIRRFEKEEKLKRTPIIAMTADAMIGSRENCLQHGMDEYVSKPVDVELLKSILGRWIELPQKQKSDAGTSAAPAPADLSILRSFTEGSLETEREFIRLFIVQSDINIDILSQNCINGTSVHWKEAAHQFKGGAANIGAAALRELCAKAQQMLNSDAAARQKMFKKIKAEYDAVRTYLLEQ